MLNNNTVASMYMYIRIWSPLKIARNPSHARQLLSRVNLTGFTTLTSVLNRKYLSWKETEYTQVLHHKNIPEKLGGLRMMDVDSMIKALRLAWIQRLLRGGHQNWKSVSYYFFNKYGGLQFILNCNYDVKYFEKLPNFIRRFWNASVTWKLCITAT